MLWLLIHYWLELHEITQESQDWVWQAVKQGKMDEDPEAEQGRSEFPTACRGLVVV